MSAAVDSQEKLMDRNRLSYWIQHVAKILSRNAKKLTSEDMQQIRYSSSKIFQIVQQIEKPSKDSFLKQFSSVDTLITVLQVVTCEQTIINIINIFIDCVGKIQPGKRASVLINHGLTTVLLQIMKLSHTNDISLTDDTLISIHTLLSRIGHKDRKFAVKARLHQTLMLTLHLIKSNFQNFRNLQPLLSVLKIYTNNSVNASYLGKNSAINILFKLIGYCGKRHTVDLRLALENLNNITKSKSNSARLIGMGGVPQLLSLHSDWQQSDTKHRCLSIRKAVLLILKNITSLKSGRKAFVNADGIRIIYESALEASDSRDMESLILLASVILRKCYPRNKLPLDTPMCPASFTLPDSPNHVPECYSLPNYPNPARSESWSGDNTAFQEGSDHSSMDDDDDIDSDDEEFRNDLEEPDEEHMHGLEPAEKRSVEEMRLYDMFFPELFLNEDNTSCNQCAQNYQDNYPTYAKGKTPPSKLQSSKSMSSMSVLDVCRKNNLEFATTSRFYQHSAVSSRTPAETQQIQKDDAEEKSCSAINLKTGSSVISLDITGKQANSKSPRTTPKTKPKKRQSQLALKEKKGRKSSSTIKIDDGLPDSIAALSLNSFDDLNDDSEQATQSSLEDNEAEFCDFTHDPIAYGQMAAQTQSVHRFQKLAFPDLYGARGLSTHYEPLIPRKFGVQRSKIFEDIDRMINEGQLVEKVVYDLDKVIAEAGDSYCWSKSNLSNRDELRIGYINASESLKFNAQFECGNLRKAIQVRQYEYDLLLSPDVNSNHHHQWFYFEVSNMEADVPYRFNIVNCEKLNSQFNFGMQPLMMSVTDAVNNTGPCWVRVGSDICYYKNHFIRSTQTTGGVKGKSYYTATFTVTFQHAGDVCYLSYHYPYTYTALKTHIHQWEKTVDKNSIFFQKQVLCKTLGGNDLSVLTITAMPKSQDRESYEELKSRPYIFLSGRVHPGESNSSWVMKGTIDFLLSRKPQAQQIREMYIFKIVPMLNPDGVLNGNHRSSLVGEDLNRRWAKPCMILHPTIYHTKGLLMYMNMINKTPLVYCDFHGHSRRKNIFLYGCSPNQTWIANDTQNPSFSGGKLHDTSFRILPRLLQSACPSFCVQNCSYAVERCKESTARVVVWRHIGVVKSYTMESSYCGCDQGKYRDQHLNTSMLEEMGHKFCESLMKLAQQKGGAYGQTMPSLYDMDPGATKVPVDEENIGYAFGDTQETQVAQSSDNGQKSETFPDLSGSDDDEDDDEEEEFDEYP